MSSHVGRASGEAVAYCGFSDTRNVGDYALFKACEQLFPSFELVPARSPEARMANLFGGGTMYPYSIRQRIYPKRPVNVAIGLGVAEPEPGRRFGLLTRWAMYRWRFQWFGVRGFRSQRILARHGISAHVTGDTALAHRLDHAASIAPGRIAVSLVGERMQRRGDEQRVFQEVRQLCERLLATGREVLIVGFCLDDMPALLELRKSLGDRPGLLDFWAPPISRDLQRFLMELGRCELLLGERLHSLVLAATVGVPFVGLAYKRKCLDFAETIGFDRFLVDPVSVGADRLERMLESGGRERRALAEELASGVSAMRERLHSAAGEIGELIARSL